MEYYEIARNITKWYYVMLRNITWYHVILGDITWNHVILSDLSKERFFLFITRNHLIFNEFWRFSIVKKSKNAEFWIKKITWYYVICSKFEWKLRNITWYFVISCNIAWYHVILIHIYFKYKFHNFNQFKIILLSAKIGNLKKQFQNIKFFLKYDGQWGLT